MTAHPVLIEGEGELDTVVMQGFPGSVSKAGAEGLACAALPGGGATAVKALDGGDRAVGPALIALLVRHLGLAAVPEVTQLQSRPQVVNDAGDVVGELVAVLPDA